MKVRAGMVSAAVAGSLLITACGAGGAGATVSGKLDDTKHKSATYTNATRTVNDYRRVCETKTRTKRSNGKTTTETYQDCKNKKVGSHTENYRRKTSSAKYCIELDHVKNGKSYEDDVWFNVDSSTYASYAYNDEGSKVSKMPYNHKGC